MATTTLALSAVAVLRRAPPRRAHRGLQIRQCRQPARRAPQQPALCRHAGSARHRHGAGPPGRCQRHAKALIKIDDQIGARHVRTGSSASAPQRCRRLQPPVGADRRISAICCRSSRASPSEQGPAGGARLGREKSVSRRNATRSASDGGDAGPALYRPRPAALRADRRGHRPAPPCCSPCWPASRCCWRSPASLMILRSVARPLADITRVTEAVAAGDAAIAVPFSAAQRRDRRAGALDRRVPATPCST